MLSSAISLEEDMMPKKKYVVTLSEAERRELRDVERGARAAYKRVRARILLKADEGKGGPSWNDARIAEALEVGRRSVERLRQRFVEEGLEASLERRVQENRCRKIDGEVEARLVAEACSKPPEGRTRWTIRLLADRLVELELVDSISPEAVRKALKKTQSNRG
jgi:transposase